MDDLYRELVYYAIIAPVVVLLGMYVAGAMIDAFLHTTNTFSYIFAGAGGLALLAAYFKKVWDWVSKKMR